MTTASAPTNVHAARRILGLDVARALAVLGMVLVDFRAWLNVADGDPQWLRWSVDRLEGRAGALFVLLAGVGVALGSRRARDTGGTEAAAARMRLLKRAGLLFGLGLLNLHIWPWDILHCYGAYLALAVLLLTASSQLLWATAGLLVGGAILLQMAFGTTAVPELWAPQAMASHLVFDGLFPVFPWAAFLVVGLWLGRQDLRDRARRTRILKGALAVAISAEALGAATAWLSRVTGRAEAIADLLCTWPRPAGPGFVLAAGGTAVAVVCVAVALTERWRSATLVEALASTGQLALTVYLVHVVVLLVPEQHGLLNRASLPTAVVYGLGFWTLTATFALAWRRRWPRGPVEQLTRMALGTGERVTWSGPLAGTDGPATPSTRPPAIAPNGTAAMPPDHVVDSAEPR